MRGFGRVGTAATVDDAADGDQAGRTDELEISAHGRILAKHLPQNELT